MTLRLLIAWALIGLAGVTSADELPRPPIGTTVAERRSDTSGPTVLVVAGGARRQRFPLHALGQLDAWPLTRGRLVTLAIDGSSVPERLEDFADSLDPDWVIRLREDIYYPRTGWDLFGGCLIHTDARRLNNASDRALKTVNASVTESANRFRRLAPKKDARFPLLAMADRIDARGILLVNAARQNTTPTRPFRASTRIRQHRLMLHALLGHLKMIDRDINPDHLVARHERRQRLAVGIYDGPGSGDPMPFVSDLQQGLRRIEGHPLQPVEIRNGALERFDVVIFPGGMASHQFDALEKTGRRAVQDFVRRGGGYVGICAGAYMAATRPYTWGLGLIDARIVDHDHWARGIGTVTIELSDPGRTLFGNHRGPLDYHYGNGPIFAPAKKKELPDYRVLAWYRTAVPGRGGADPAVMINTPAILSGRYGKGRVLVSSGHSEWSAGIEAFMLRYVEWTGARRARP
ncbi:MAG: BPL-N domain-containing protein [Planctomycetaceae bacterium]